MQLTAALGKQVTELFAAFNTQWQAAREKEQQVAAAERQKAEAEMQQMKKENDELRRRMLQVEEARLAQDARMTEVLDRMLQQMAGTPGPMQTPGREQAGYQTNQLEPVSIGKPQRERQMMQATSREQVQTLSEPATPTVKEQALEAALKSLLEHGDKTDGSVRQFLTAQGHEQVAGMYAEERGERSASV